MRRGEIYRTRERVPERGAKPGFYVVVSRTFVAEHDTCTRGRRAPADYAVGSPLLRPLIRASRRAMRALMSAERLR